MTDQNGYRYHARRLVALGLPLVGGQIAAFAIHMTDTVMLGWYSVEALAASVLGGAYWFVIYIFGAGFGFAVMPVVASAISGGDPVRVRRTTRMALWISVIYGLLFLPLFIWSAPVLALLGQPPEVADLAGQYLAIAGLGMIPALLVQVFRSYLSALEKAHVVLWITVAAFFANIVVNYALIFGNWGAPELGVRGAAIASVMVQIVSVIGVIIYSAVATPEHMLFVRLWRPDWAALGNIFSLGWPIGLTTLAEVGLFNAAAVMMGWIGVVPLAAHGIALQIAAFFFMVHLGLASAATVRIGQAWGAHDRVGLRRIAIASNGISGVIALLVIVIYLIFGAQIIGMFVDPADPVRDQVIATGITFLYVAAAFQIADAGQVQALSILRGMHDTRVPMIMASVSYWLLGLPVSYLLGFTLGLGGVGVWIGLTIGLASAWISMGARLLRLAFRDPVAG